MALPLSIWAAYRCVAVSISGSARPRSCAKVFTARHRVIAAPIIGLSSLAEGADRLVARVALAYGAKLIAPLPMPPDEYRRDFEPGLKPTAAEEFDRLKDQAMAAPVMRFAPGNSPENVREES